MVSTNSTICEGVTMTTYKGHQIKLMYQPYGIESPWVLKLNKKDFVLGQYRMDTSKTLIDIESEAKEKIDNYLKKAS